MLCAGAVFHRSLYVRKTAPAHPIALKSARTLEISGEKILRVVEAAWLHLKCHESEAASTWGAQFGGLRRSLWWKVNLCQVPGPTTP
jgi:hypothetical protein